MISRAGRLPRRRDLAMEAAVMDPLSLMIFIGIGNMVAWLAALYVRGALAGAGGLLYVTRLRRLA